MHGVNLLPAWRQTARRRRARLRLWLTIDGAYALVLAAGCALFVTTRTGTSGGAFEEELHAAAAREQTITRTIAGLRQEISVAQHALLVAQRVGRHPNWGIPLALIASVCGEDVVLRRCRLEPAPAVGGAAGPQPANGYSLELSGFGRSQAAVSQLVLQLEDSPILDSVTLLETRREAFLAGTAIGFQIECVIRESGREGGQQP